MLLSAICLLNKLRQLLMMAWDQNQQLQKHLSFLSIATVRIFYQDWVYFENINSKIKIAVFKWMINHTASRNQNSYKLNIFLKVVCYLSTLRCWLSNNSIYQICRCVSEEHRIDAHLLISPSHCQTNIYFLFFLKKNKSKELNNTSRK